MFSEIVAFGRFRLNAAIFDIRLVIRCHERSSRIQELRTFIHLCAFKRWMADVIADVKVGDAAKGDVSSTGAWWVVFVRSKELVRQ